MKTVSVLSVDPSLSNFGMVRAEIDIETLTVFVSDLILIATEKMSKKLGIRQSSDDLVRAQKIDTAFQREAAEVTFVISEIPSGSQSSRGSFSNGCCVGVLAGSPVPVIQVTPTEVKLASAGNKNASKDDMIKWATARHPDAPWPTEVKKGKKKFVAGKCEHLADALAAIYAALLTDQFKQVISLLRSQARIAH